MVAGFRKAGIYPFDREKVPAEQLVRDASSSSSVTHMTNSTTVSVPTVNDILTIPLAHPHTIHNNNRTTTTTTKLSFRTSQLLTKDNISQLFQQQELTKQQQEVHTLYTHHISLVLA